MAKHKKRKNDSEKNSAREPADRSSTAEHRLHPDTKKSIWAISFAGAAIILALAGFSKAGPAGDAIYQGLDTLFGWGYFILPLTLIFTAGVFLVSERKKMVGVTSPAAHCSFSPRSASLNLSNPARADGWALYSARSAFPLATRPPSF